MIAGDLPIFDLSIYRRGRAWRWSVIDRSGISVLTGCERSRPAARYMAARAIVVDDHAAFRASARRLLELTGYDVVAEAGDGASGLALVRDLEPELVLLDVALPAMSGRFRMWFARMLATLPTE